MPAQFNNLPTYATPLAIKGQTTNVWYRYFQGLFTGVASAQEVPVAVTASPMTFTAPVGGRLIVQGGTVSLIEFSRNAVNFYNVGVTAGPIPLNSQDLVRITYTVPPTLTFVPT